MLSRFAHSDALAKSAKENDCLSERFLSQWCTLAVNTTILYLCVKCLASKSNSIYRHTISLHFRVFCLATKSTLIYRHSIPPAWMLWPCLQDMKADQQNSLMDALHGVVTAVMLASSASHAGQLHPVSAAWAFLSVQMRKRKCVGGVRVTSPQSCLQYLLRTQTDLNPFHLLGCSVNVYIKTDGLSLSTSKR